MGRILRETRPEAVYFTERNGHRGAMLIFDLADPSTIPSVAETWFLAFDADVEFRVVMTPEDVAKSGLASAGTKWAKPEEVKLSQVIDILNERFGTDFSEADQLFFDSVIAEAKEDDQVKRWAEANPLDGFALAMKGKLRDAVVDRLDKNDRIATRYLNEEEFQNVAFKELVKRIYEDLRKAG